MEKAETLTPMMIQYHQIKEQHQDTVLFFRLGDFYEMFEEDAVEVSRLLNLTLTKRNGQPMCGIPYHAAKVYLKRLLEAGKKIAICEQTQLSQGNRQLAQREVVQVVTPATVVEDDFLQADRDSFILSIAFSKKSLSVSYADITSGQFFLRTVLLDDRFNHLASVLAQVGPREILVNEDDYFLHQDFQTLLDTYPAMVTKLPSWHFSRDKAYERLCKQIGTTSLKAFDLEQNDPILGSAGALLWYIQETAKTSLDQIQRYEVVGEETLLSIDEASRKSLELLTNLNDGTKAFSLFSAIDATLTSMGARTLKRWITNVLTDLSQIQFRQDWVTLLYEDRSELGRIRSHLKQVLDLQRLTSRIAMNRHLPKDLVGIAQTVQSFFQIIDQRYQTLLGQQLDQSVLALLVDLVQRIQRAINTECQGAFEEGKVILTGYDQVLDELRSHKAGGKQLLSAYLEKVREQTGITTLKLSSNKILGHYLEVSKAQAERVPATFYRKQTLVNAERFTSDELIACEQTILQSSFEAEKRERDVYEQLVSDTRSLQQVLLSISTFLSDLDCLQSLASTAITHGYSKPEFVEEDVMEIIGARHPVVEQHLPVGAFVANDLTIGSTGKRFCLITGPNMAGKSTFLRQTALIVLLAQMGSYVPAVKARLSLVDRLYCRVGASDNLARGESTFLVEMQEAAHILRTASRRSLVIIDELGRGTSTQDGMSIAYAVMQQLLDMGSKTLFATHYHELARIDTSSIQLLTLQVSENNGEVRFLRRVIEGIANSSYGLNVAKMAGISREVLKMARSFQKQHFAEYDLASQQPDLFSIADEPSQFDEQQIEVLSQIESFSIEQSSPLDALIFLKKLQETLKHLV
ncbi:DNA mismatch repair protein MutS [Sphaerochaeta sp.]|jgi:DNA mismatch repair protein MutS|uniref:DNA mismatch repair protein MutS n=1 Tax=Sphaerochaeta sp. TaxID=1972642 RepID=UPI002FCC3360